MQFEPPLLSGHLVRRYKRFLADIELTSGRVITAHCPNPGAMLGLVEVGTPVWVSPLLPGKTRKLEYRWELAFVDDVYVGLNTLVPNQCVYEALQAGKIPELTCYSSIQPEVKYGRNSRIDFLLRDPHGGRCYVEVKNVHLKRYTQAHFPDSKTVRGTKHLEELRQVRAQGARAVMLYVVQRGDCESFALADDIDPVYSQAATRAEAEGVDFLCYGCSVTPEGVFLASPLPIDQSRRGSFK